MERRCYEHVTTSLEGKNERIIQKFSTNNAVKK